LKTSFDARFGRANVLILLRNQMKAEPNANSNEQSQGND